MIKLNVAHKVILGFTFIALLLLLSSGSALISFSAITGASDKVNSLAVPVQQQSNLAQMQLLRLAKLSALGFTAEAEADIKSYQQQFNSGSENLRSTMAQLTQLTSKEPAFITLLQKIDSHYQQYAEAVDSMFNERLRSIDLQRQVQDSLLIQVQLIDNIGANLLDISYLDLPGGEKQMELIAGSANRIDGQLLGLLNTLKEVSNYNALDAAESGQENRY